MSATQLSIRFWLIILVLLPLAVAPPFGLVQWRQDRLIVSAALIGILAAVIWRARTRKRIERQRVEEEQVRCLNIKRELLTSGGACLWVVAPFFGRDTYVDQWFADLAGAVWRFRCLGVEHRVRFADKRDPQMHRDCIGARREFVQRI